VSQGIGGAERLIRTVGGEGRLQAFCWGPCVLWRIGDSDEVPLGVVLEGGEAPEGISDERHLVEGGVVGEGAGVPEGIGGGEGFALVNVLDDVPHYKECSDATSRILPRPAFFRIGHNPSPVHPPQDDMVQRAGGIEPRLAGHRGSSPPT